MFRCDALLSKFSLVCVNAQHLFAANIASWCSMSADCYIAETIRRVIWILASDTVFANSTNISTNIETAMLFVNCFLVLSVTRLLLQKQLPTDYSITRLCFCYHKYYDLSLRHFGFGKISPYSCCCFL